MEESSDLNIVPVVVMLYRIFSLLSLLVIMVLAGKPLRANPIEPASQTARLWISNRYLVKADSNIIISQILLDTLKNPTSFFTETIEYNKDVIEFVDVKNGEQTPLPGWNINKIVTTLGIVQISATSSDAPLVDSGEILRLIFHVVDSARAFQTSPILDSAVSLGPGTTVVPDTGMLRVFDACTPIVEQGGQPLILSASCFPNPVEQQATIAFTLPVPAADLELRVFNASGGIVYSKSEGVEPIGHHQLSLDVSDLPNGIYFYEIFADGARQFHSFFVSH